MTLASMMTQSVQIMRRTVTGHDASNNELAAFVLIDTVDAFVGRRDTTETVAGRDQVIADWAFMFPAGTSIEPYDRLVHDGMTFEVVGVPASAVKPGVGEQFISVKGRFVG